MNLQIRSVDDLLRGQSLAAGMAHEIAPNLLFHPGGHIRYMLDEDNLVGRDGMNGRIRAAVTEGRKAEAGLPTGLFELRDVYLAPPFGMILDIDRHTCWLGSMLGWSQRDFNNSDKFRGCTVRDGALDFAMPGDIQEIDAAVLISAPHYYNYGHWLLEFLPRIDMAASAGFGGLPFYSHSGHAWSEELANCLAPVTLLPGAWSQAMFTRVKRLIVPSMARIGNGGDEAALTSTWARLGAALSQRADATGDDGRDLRKIAVSRSGWSDSANTRRLMNAARMERLLEERGFTVIHPHAMSLARQRDVFHQADVVVGEDGSAMHNTIYCRPGTRIGLVAMGRINYAHLLTAKALGHRVTYIPTDVADGHEASAILGLRRLRPRVLSQGLAELLEMEDA